MSLRALAAVCALVVMVAVGLWIGLRPGSGQAGSEAPLVPVERGSVLLTVTADGSLEPKTTVQVKSYAGGRIDELAVEVGDRVAKGDLIAEIDPTDSRAAYDQAAAELAAAQARLRQAREQARVQPELTRAAIAQAEASYRSAVNDLARLEEAAQPQSRAQVKSSLARARANYELAQRELERARELKQQGFLSQSDVDTALNRRDLARAELDNVQEQWDTLERSLDAELEASRARVDQANAALDRAKADAIQDELREADVASAEAQVARAQASLDQARTLLEYTTITASRDGVILERLVEEGTIITSGRSAVAQGTDIVLLGDLTEMFVEVSLNEADVSLIEPGQRADVLIDALPGERFRGVVSRIDPRAVTQQNVTTVLVTVRIENPDPRLKPGMTATCEFIVGRAEDVLRLPNLVIQRDGGGHTVLVPGEAGPTPVPVEIGLVGDSFTEIRGGLSEGDQVLLPFETGAAGGVEDWATERGRRMGGASGFVRNR